MIIINIQIGKLNDKFCLKILKIKMQNLFENNKFKKINSIENSNVKIKSNSKTIHTNQMWSHFIQFKAKKIWLCCKFKMLV